MSTQWPLKRLGDVCEIRNGATPATNESALWDGPHAWITPAEMGSLESPYVSLTKRTLTNDGLSACSATLAPPKSVILSCRAPIGHLVINQVPMATNQGCKSLVPGSLLDHKFLYFFLKANVELLDSLGTGATFRELSATKLRDVEIPVPSLAEQQRIVAKLDSVADLASGLGQAAEMAVSMWDDLYASECRRAFEPRSGWKSVVLPEISENLDGIRRPVTRADREPGPYPYYGASGVVDHVAGYLFDEELLLISEDGANLLARSTPIAFTASGQYWVNNHAHVLRFKSPTIHAYVEAYLNSIPIDEWVTGAAQPKLTQGALNRIPIPFPGSDAEIKSVLMSLQDAQRLAAAGRANSGRRMNLSRDLQQSILEAAFRGEL